MLFGSQQGIAISAASIKIPVDDSCFKEEGLRLS
jgi:hypothetical protein